ncbi:hypothetical protein JAAARDRAFT_138055, partial [Jaapia argillacea MUCL 33604]
KKKPKLNDFDEQTIVGDTIAPRPSSYAISKLQGFKYVELFYFTREGCLDAFKNAHTTADDALSLTGTDGYVTLRPVAAFKASRNVVRDEDLTWEQMTMGKNAMLQMAEKLGWNAKHITALATFYFNLEQHPSRGLDAKNRALLLYQARVRRDWHDRLERDEGFNIGTINETLLRSISEEIWSFDRSESMKRSVILFPPLRRCSDQLPFSAHDPTINPPCR